ncbi:MAG: NFACT family protein [Treponema sp.]|nr:NFACT family protein [Treponema sp.]
MSLNCNEINKVLEELDVTGCFIQDVIQPGFDTLALYLYKEATPITLLICIANGGCRINSTNRKIPKNEKPLRFMEFLKSRIKGARINSCAQIGLERIIKMELKRGDEEFFLYIRLWSSAANIILTDTNGTILDTMFRRPGKDEKTLGHFDEPVIDPSKPQREFPVRDFSQLEQKFLEEHPGHSPLTFNQKIDIYYSEYASSLSREALLESCERWYNTHHSKLESALEKLLQKKEDFSHADQKKHQGDLITSFGHNITTGSNFLECEDYETGKTIQIKIDPKKSVHENAQVYYEAYKKEISGLEQLDTDIENTRHKIERLDKEYKAMLAEKNPVKIEQMLRKDTKPKQQKEKSHPGLDYTIDGWYILVGRDANENDELLRRHVRGSDMWFHTRDCPGGYVFVKYRAGKTIPLEIMLAAGNLAVYYSKARKQGKADLYYTQVKHLRRAKNGPKGLVLPSQEKNLSITLDQKILNHLDSLKQEAEGI